MHTTLCFVMLFNSQGGLYGNELFWMRLSCQRVVEPYSDTHDIRMDEVISEMRYDDLSGVLEREVGETGLFDEESMVDNDEFV